jgi:hypothetical protein
MKKIQFMLALLIFVSFGITGDAIYDNCMSCHISDKIIYTTIYPAINTSFFGVHIDINTTDGPGTLSDGDCKVCHYNVSRMNSEGFTVDTYKCEDCHVNGAVQRAPRVYNHIKNGNISVNAMCSDCHNKTVNLFRYNASASVAHYGKNAGFGLPTGEEYCAFCHQNSSTGYKDAMQNKDNAAIEEHSSSSSIKSDHPSGNLTCTICHGQDMLHGSNISKPSLNSDLCVNCHKNDPLNKNKHNNKVECISCHMDKPSDIHTIKYIMQDGSYLGINATVCSDCHNFSIPLPYFQLPFSAANCTTCHQGNGLPKFPLAPKIPTPVKHSNNPISGALWNGSQPAYWSSTAGACNYCHGNTLHGSKAPGNIENISYGNLPGQDITSTSYWCANCHYNTTSSGNYSYKGNLLSPVPPEITNNTGLVPQKAQDETKFFNHSLKVWSDNICLTCHSTDSPKSTTQFIHNVSVGGSGGSCISCHAQPPGGMSRPNTTGAHDLHKSIGYGITPISGCDSCHSNGGINEASILHPNGIYNISTNISAQIATYIQIPATGSDDTCSGVSCHTKDLPSNAVAGTATWNTSTAGRCDVCHSTLSSGLPASDAHSIHNITRGYTCNTCHNGSIHKNGGNANISFSGLANTNGTYSTSWSTSSQTCVAYCHDPNGAYPGGDKLTVWTNTTNRTCTSCHSYPPVKTRNNITHTTSTNCDGCHGKGASVGTQTGHINGIINAAGADCTSCHDINSTIAPSDKRIDFAAFDKGVHRDLNTGKNKACWACHGDGTEPAGHPANYKTPKKCSSDNCHSLNQDYRAPMVYSHFKNASLNNNPGNALNYNVTTLNNCEECHANGAISQGKNIVSTASHYASLELPESINCIYCHLNEDNAKKWGNATLINENRTSIVELDRAKNKFKVKAGESINIDSRFRLKLLEVSKDRTALIELFKDNILVDTTAADAGNYTYEETLMIDNSSIKVPVIILNFTGFFYSGNSSFIQFEGFRTRRVHAENKTTSCYLCHVNSRQQIKYRVIERVNNSKDDIYYTEEFVNFTDRKQYNETDALQVLSNIIGTDKNVDIESQNSKVLFEGEVWNISEDFSIQVKGTTKENDEAYISIQAGKYSFEDIVNKGEIFEFDPELNYLGYQTKNVTIFRAKVTDIIHAKPNAMIVLEEVMAISPDIKKVQEKQVIEGYNTSWLWENSTIIAGNIPSDFHSPQLFDGKDGGADCLSCHGINGFSQKKVVVLGKHETLKGGGNSACYACHGGNEQILSHPTGFRSPRECKGCHAGTIDNYSAVYIGDEEHKNETCVDCHITDSHNLKVFDVLPSVKKISIIKQDNETILMGFASAGYKMKVRGARYYIDSQSDKFSISPVDGVFDSQTEEISARINVSRISPGKHVIYVEAMERDDKWGAPASIEINVEGEEIKLSEENDLGLGILAGGLTLILIFINQVIRGYLNSVI